MEEPNISYNLTLSWKFDPSWMVFAKLGTGTGRAGLQDPQLRGVPHARPDVNGHRARRGLEPRV